MKIRIAVLTFALVLGLVDAPPVRAQNSEMAAKLKTLTAQLNLTPQQKVALLPVLEAEAPKLREIKNNASMPPLQKAQALRAVHAESDPKVKSILTPAQYTKWQGIRQQEIQQAIQKKRAAKS